MNVLVYAEHQGGTLTPATGGLVTAASGVAGDDGRITMLLVGAGAGEAAEAASGYALAEILVYDDAAADRHDTEPKTAALVAAIAATDVDCVLYPADPFVSDVVCRAAIRTDGGVIGDATTVTREADGGLAATKAIFGGAMTSHCRVKPSHRAFIGIVPNSYPAAAPDASAAPRVTALEVELAETDTRVVVDEVDDSQAGDRPNITDAPIIVSGGRGLGNAEGFELLERLADTVGAAVGASRAATDAGWYPHSHQIGQTGKMVAPQVYLACGISGAIQHRAGMQTSQHVIAINSDPDAPITSIADLSVIGDLNNVVPELIKQLEQAQG